MAIKKANRGKSQEIKEKISEKLPVLTSPEKSRLSPKTKKILFTIIGILILVLVLFTLGKFLIAATVNGKPISRLEVISILEKQGGKQTLEQLITKSLILQEAEKQNITVTQEEIDADIKKISDNLSKQGQSLESALKLQNYSRTDLEDQIRVQKIIEKSLSKDIEVTDKDVEDYLEKNKDLISEEANVKPEELKKNIKEQLKQEKLNDRFQKWVEELKTKAKINTLVTY